MRDRIKLVVTDLDGTLLNDENKVSPEDLESLLELKNREVCVVAATGRSVYSVNKVLPPNFPIDYLVFSSGAGIFDWHKKILKKSFTVPSGDVNRALQILLENDADFMIHRPVPDNHKFYFRQSGRKNPDFITRLEVYSEFASPLGSSDIFREDSSQILVIFPPEDGELFGRLVFKIDFLNKIRTTSPFDKKSMWLELFPLNVSKAEAIKWICEEEKIDQSETMAVGNDFNDIDMLEWVEIPFVVENAPDELKELFRITGSNNSSGFSQAVTAFFI